MAEKKRTYEARGADVESAIEAGLAYLGVERNDVDVEVLDKGSRGLLGIGSREAVVKLTTEAPAKTKAKAAPVAPKKDEKIVAAMQEWEAAVAASAPEVLPATGQSEEVASAEDDEVVAAEAEEEVVAEEAEEVATKVATKVAAEVAAESEDDEESDDDADALLLEEADCATAILDKMLEELELDGAISMERSEPDDRTGQQVPIIQIDGDDLSELIGSRGETLHALQYITRLMVGHQLRRRAYLIIDVDGYRQKREQALYRLAERMADKVIRRGRPVTLEPMPPNERRVIHLALREHEEVYTQSAGDGKQRKVRIFPK
ncbi:MAG TPA: RNA-binding cell elongation regulator Jag/EloR [Anaerolineae bacterium]|nr:RNA-binding cell elongation regulator Jag/EloR [Anaerolineae bacterium]